MTVEIYALTGADQAYSAVPPENKLLLSPTTDSTGNLSYLQTTQIMINRTKTNNSAPIQEEARKPDTGFNGIQYIYSIYLGHNAAGRTADLTRIKNWLTASQAVRSADEDKRLPHGKFGIKDTDNPEFDIHPERTSGAKFVSFSLDFDAHDFQRHAKLILEHSGNAEKIGDVSGRNP